MSIRKRHEISLPDNEWLYLKYLSDLKRKSISKLISIFIKEERKENDPYAKFINHHLKMP